MDRDTDIGGSGGRFPATRWSVITAARGPDPEARRLAFEALVAAYWKPVYKYLRIRFRLDNEDAKDLTQGFFAVAFEKGFFDAYDPARARFRTFLRTCLDRFAANQRKAASRLKRGGQALLVPLDFEGAEGELKLQPADPGADLEALFRREWVRHLFGQAVEALRRHCAEGGKDVHFALFRRYDLDADEAETPPSYAELAEELAIPVTQVTNHLAWARREFRRLVLDTLRHVVGSEEEFRAEAREILGTDIS